MRSTFKTVLVAMLAVFALSAVAASAAQAEEAPYFKIVGTRLAEGSSKEFTAKASPILIAVGGAFALECSLAPASGAKLLGSKAGTRSTAEMTLEFTSCIVLDQSGCKVTETIKTQPLLAKLVSLGERGKGKLGVLIEPKKGITFMRFKLNNEGCVFGGEHIVDGSPGAAELWSGETPVEVGKEPAEAKTLQLRLPGDGPITHVWEVKGGVGSEIHVEETLNTSLGAVEITGASTLELAGSPSWGVFA